MTDGVGEGPRSNRGRRDDKRIVIVKFDAVCFTESLINSIETATQKGKLKVSSINDFTSEDVEIELTLPRGVYAEEVVQQLYTYTDCEVSVSSNIITIDGRSPRELIGERVTSEPYGTTESSNEESLNGNLNS